MKASLSHKKLVLSPRSVAKLAVKIFYQLAALARLELFSLLVPSDARKRQRSPTAPFKLLKSTQVWRFSNHG